MKKILLLLLIGLSVGFFSYQKIEKFEKPCKKFIEKQKWEKISKKYPRKW